MARPPRPGLVQARFRPDVGRRAGASTRAFAAGVAMSLAVALGACGEVEARAPVFRPIARPALTVAPDAQPDVPLAPWSTLEPAAGEVEVVQALRTEIVPDPGVERSPGLLELFHRNWKGIAIPIPADARRLDRVSVRVAIARFDSLRFVWSRNGVERGAESLPLFPAPAAAEYVFDLPPGTGAGIDRLEIRVVGEGRAAIGRIELFELDGAHRLPRPGTTAEFVRIGDDVRSAWGLVPFRPAEIRFVPPPNGILFASVAIPPRLYVRDDAPILSVQVTGASGFVRVHRYPLVESDAGTRWMPVRVPLEVSGQATAHVRFLLESRFPTEATCAITQPQVVEFDEDAPTVLLVTSDTHRGDHVGFAGSSVPVRTPVVDALAARGVAFTDAWSATNVTLPSHASIFTGLSPRDTRILENTHALAADARTLAEAFAESGWATVAAVSASHLDADWSGLGQGFDRMAVCGTAKRGAGETLAHLERWIPDFRGRPLFVWLHLFDAHTPYAPPQPLDRSAWDPSKDPRDESLPAPDPRLVPSHLEGVRDLNYVVAQYRGEVNYLDSELGRLLDRSRFRDAIVAFTADHGESFGSHGVYWDHGGLYRDRLHVPLILRWPGAPAATRVDARVANLDVGRTLLDLAGLAAVEHPGTSLLTRVEASADDAPVFAIACYRFSASIADGDDLLILHLEDHALHARGADGNRRRHAVELYDVPDDPECRTDQSASRRARAGELRARLVSWLRAGETLDWKRAPLGSVEVLENLTALGYSRGADQEPGSELFPSACDCAECRAYEP